MKDCKQCIHFVRDRTYGKSQLANRCMYTDEELQEFVGSKHKYDFSMSVQRNYANQCQKYEPTNRTHKQY